MTSNVRRVLIVVLACALGVAAAYAFGIAARLVRPCTGEQLSCSMTVVVGLVTIAISGAVALLAYGLAMLWKNDARALAMALLVPLVSFLLFAAYVKGSAISVREFGEIRETDIDELLQIVIPVVLMLTVPWFVLRPFVGR